MGTAGSKVAHHEDADKPKDDAEVPKLRPWQWTVDQEGIQKQAGEMRAGGAAGCDDPIGIVTTVEDEDECFKDLEKSLAGRDPATLPPGPVGNTILHTALLRGKYKLARAILERYPQLVKVPYQLRRSLNDKNASMYVKLAPSRTRPRDPSPTHPRFPTHPSFPTHAPLLTSSKLCLRLKRDCSRFTLPNLTLVRALYVLRAARAEPAE